MIRKLLALALAAALTLAPTLAGTLPSPSYGTVSAATSVVLPDGTSITCGGSGSTCVAMAPALAAEAATARAAEQANATAISAETGRAGAAEALLAPLVSPALIGTPTAPTPPISDSSTTIGTTAFVKLQGYVTAAGAAAAAPVQSVAGHTGAVTLGVGDVSGAAPLASPAITGTPTAPTAGAGTNTTQIATTAFATGAVATEAARAQAAEGLAVQRSANLSDLGSSATARSNLGLAGVAASGSASDLGTGTLPAARLPAFTGDVTTPAGSTATTLAASGVTAGTYGGTTTVPVVTVDAKGRVTAVSSVAAAGTGTVTSVGLSVPSDEAVSPSNVTSSGTFAITRNAQAANVVFAGPASGSNAVPAYRALVSADLPPALPDGCIRLSVQSSTVLALTPYGCSTLAIGGVPRPVTAATCSIASPAASTVYYVYAAWSGTAVTCSFSMAGHVTGSDGREYLNASGSANTAQRLVGMVYTTSSTSAPLSDSATYRGVLNWFNRRGLSLSASASGVGTSSTTAVYLNAPAVTFLCWGDEAYVGAFLGSVSNNQASGVSYIAYAIDNAGVTVEQTFQPASANILGPIGVAYVATLSEGAHTATGAVRTNSAGNSGSWSFTHSASTRG